MWLYAQGDTSSSSPPVNMLSFIATNEPVGQDVAKLLSRSGPRQRLGLSTNCQSVGIVIASDYFGLRAIRARRALSSAVGRFAASCLKCSASDSRARFWARSPSANKRSAFLRSALISLDATVG